MSARPLPIVLLAAAAGLAALSRGTEAQEAVAVGRAIAPDASVKVWNGGGSVRVEGWDADSLAVAGTVAEAGGGRFFLRAGGDAAKLGVEGDQAEVRGTLVVRLPRTATVWIRTATADVEVRGLVGSVDVHTAAGSVDLEGRPERLYAESMAGDLALRVEGGVVRARSGTGRLSFAGTAEDLALDAVSGTLSVETPALRRGRLTTVDGAVRFTGALRPAGALIVETHSGDVTLRLPRDLAADVRLSTFEGRIDAGWPEAPRADRGPGRRTLEFEMGGGGAEVAVRTFSGAITLSPRGEEDVEDGTSPRE